MNVLMVAMKMDIGGAETHILELSRALSAQGVGVTVASAGGVYESALAEAGISHVKLPLDRKTPLALWRARRGLCELLRKGSFDLVHAHARIPAFLCGRLQRKFGFRFVTTAHFDFRLTPLLRRLSDWGEYTFAVSEDIRRYLLQNYRLNPNHIALTVNGIDTEHFSPKHEAPALRRDLSPDEKPVILHVSRLEKNSSLCATALMESMKYFAGRVRLVIVGDGACAQALRARAEDINRSLGLDAISLVGARTNISEYIAACDVFVGPSRAAMEAMACGKPTILSGSEGHGGIFCEELVPCALETNLCFRGKEKPQASRLAQEIETLLSMDATQRALIGARGRAFVIKQYSVQTMVQTHWSVYQKLLTYRTGGIPDIVICGYYGYGNAGDDSLLSGIVEGIRRREPSLGICVMSARPSATRSYEIVDAVNRFSLFAVRRRLQGAKLFLFGGGNLLQNKTSTHSLLYYTHMIRMAKACGARVMIYANGIGPISGSKNIERVKKSLVAADSLSFRDRSSLRFAQMLVPRKDLRLTFDPAILLKKREETTVPDVPYFVVIPKKTVPDNEARLISLICHLRKQHGLRPILLSLYDAEDREYAKRIAISVGAELTPSLTASAHVALLSQASLTISSRLHGLIYATVAICPMMSISDDEKLSSYLDYIGFGAESLIPCATDANADASFLCQTADRILASSENVRETIAKGLPEWRTTAEKEFSEAIRAVHDEKNPMA